MESNGCQPKESHVRLCLGASQPQQSATDSEDLKSISDVEGRTGPTESNGCQPKESHVRLCLGASQPQQSATDSEDQELINDAARGVKSTGSNKDKLEESWVRLCLGAESRAIQMLPVDTNGDESRCPYEKIIRVNMIKVLPNKEGKETVVPPEQEPRFDVGRAAPFETGAKHRRPSRSGTEDEGEDTECDDNEYERSYVIPNETEDTDRSMPNLTFEDPNKEWQKVRARQLVPEVGFQERRYHRSSSSEDEERNPRELALAAAWEASPDYLISGQRCFDECDPSRRKPHDQRKEEFTQSSEGERERRKKQRDREKLTPASAQRISPDIVLRNQRRFDERGFQPWSSQERPKETAACSAKGENKPRRPEQKWEELAPSTVWRKSPVFPLKDQRRPDEGDFQPRDVRERSKGISVLLSEGENGRRRQQRQQKELVPAEKGKLSPDILLKNMRHFENDEVQQHGVVFRPNRASIQHSKRETGQGERERYERGPSPAFRHRKNKKTSDDDDDPRQKN